MKLTVVHTGGSASVWLDRASKIVIDGPVPKGGLGRARKEFPADRVRSLHLDWASRPPAIVVQALTSEPNAAMNYSVPEVVRVDPVSCIEVENAWRDDGERGTARLPLLHATNIEIAKED